MKKRSILELAVLALVIAVTLGVREEESWRLVRFIRHLPHITPEEIEQMEGLNPTSPEKIRQQIEDEKFLGDATDESPTSTSTHQH